MGAPGGYPPGGRKGAQSPGRMGRVTGEGVCEQPGGLFRPCKIGAGKKVAFFCPEELTQGPLSPISCAVPAKAGMLQGSPGPPSASVWQRSGREGSQGWPFP